MAWRGASWLPRALGALGLTALGVGCGGGGTDPNPPPGSGPASIVEGGGGGQTQRTNTSVAIAPWVVVRDAGGQPVSGETVLFSVTQGGGSISGNSVTTDAQGIARVGSWTLGVVPGPQTLSAQVVGTSLTRAIVATARYPHWTVAVYMAADNSLAFDGVQDMDEMEAATRDPEVQVVVQAEFNGAVLAQYGCTNPACINRPNFTTFRYALTGAGMPRPGPDGSTTDLGNRDMTSAGQLAEFIQWARTAAPAEHLLLVPWNHGGGYTGLLSDEASAPGSSGMTMTELRTALQMAGGTPIDVVDFDMCLMGAYETLVTLQGLANSLSSPRK